MSIRTMATHRIFHAYFSFATSTQFFFYVCCLCRSLWGSLYSGQNNLRKTNWLMQKWKPNWALSSLCIHLTKNLHLWIWGMEELEWSCQWQWKLLWVIHESDLQSCNKTVHSLCLVKFFGMSKGYKIAQLYSYWRLYPILIMNKYMVDS